MIGFLSGKILSIGDGVIVDVNGVGYALMVPQRLQESLKAGAMVELFVHTNVRENAIELFGFASVWERQVFLLLTSVSGIGPRTALGLLSKLDPAQILTAVIREDRATLSSVSGIGKKTAERLIVEIADKARKLFAERGGQAANAPSALMAGVVPARKKAIPAQGASVKETHEPTREMAIADLWNDALAALVNLGYDESSALAAIRQASAEQEQLDAELSLEALIRRSLQFASKGRA